MSSDEESVDDQPTFPIELSPSLTLISLGKLVTDRPAFHCNRYLFPVGYVSEKVHMSLKDGVSPMVYRSMILDRGGQGPVFRVEVADDTNTFFESDAPSTPWTEIRCVIFKARNVQTNKRLPTASGPGFFGFSSPIVGKLFREMKGVEFCKNFQSQSISPKTKSRSIYRNLKTPVNFLEHSKSSSKSNNLSDDEYQCKTPRKGRRESSLEKSPFKSLTERIEKSKTSKLQTQSNTLQIEKEMNSKTTSSVFDSNFSRKEVNFSAPPVFPNQYLCFPKCTVDPAFLENKKSDLLIEELNGSNSKIHFNYLQNLYQTAPNKV